MLKLKKIKANIFQIILLPICVGFVILSFLFKTDGNMQIQIAITSLFVYIAFSMLHHHFDKSLTLTVILEYIFIGILALILLLGTIT